MSGAIFLEQQELKEVRAILNRRLPAGTKAYVFGSRAGGRAKPSSDLDLLLEGDGPLPLDVLATLADEFDISRLRWKVDIVDRSSVSPEFARIVDATKVRFPLSEIDEMSGRLILHQDPRSGNCYKIALTAALLGIPLSIRNYDIVQGETRTPDFLAQVNANGRIPVLQIGDRFLPESNAACWYLAQGSALIPADHFKQADVLRWMFFEQYNHEPNVATLRFWLRFVGQAKLSEAQRGQISAKRAAGDAALRLMDDHLVGHDWFVGGAATLADIALFAYTHICEQGSFALDDYPAVQKWLARMRALPGFVAMEE